VGFKKDDSGTIPKSSFKLQLVFLPRVYFLGYSSILLAVFLLYSCSC